MLARRRLGSALFGSSAVISSISIIPTVVNGAQPAAATSRSLAVSSHAAFMCTAASSLHLQQQRRFNATSSASAESTTEGGSSGTALDVAMKVNKLKRMHQSGQGQGKKEVERMAWKELNTLSEQQIATAEGKAVALLLNSWAYFARFWEKGKDGPFDATEASAAAALRQ